MIEETMAFVVGVLMGCFIGMLFGGGLARNNPDYEPKEAWDLYQESIERTEKRYDEAYGLGGVE